MINEQKFDCRTDISWLNVWFVIGVIGNLIILGDLVNVWDIGLGYDLNDIIGMITEIIGGNQP